MKKKIFLIIAIVFLIGGLSVILYPSICQKYNEQQDIKRIEEFDESVSQMNDDADKDLSSNDDDTTKPVYDKKLLDKLYNDMHMYNNNLVTNGQNKISDPFAYETPSFDLSAYGIYDNIFGYVSAPSINLKMPIYLGANSTNMWFGCAHLTYTSVPIGGNNTNTVLAGHRGVVTKMFFDNIVNLNEGDTVSVTNFWTTLNYKVIATKVINPTDNEDIYIQRNKELLTLITCHPYGYSDQRYIVICERVS
ncbi:MAG TPA: class C sortase [Clostridiales bacterium]|nr:class C sortase [Clostridiales bacterium]